MLTALGVLSLTLLSACGETEGPTREELIQQVNFLTSDVIWLEDELSSTSAMLGDSQRELNRIQGILMEPDRVVITELTDGTGRTSFMLGDDGELFFPRELFLSGTTALPNTARIMLGGDVSIIPAGNWVVNVQGTTVHYSHPNGIRGMTRVGATEHNANRYTMMESLEIFFEDFPTATVTYSDIFISGTLRGIHARATTFVEEEPHVIHAFVISNTRVNLLGVFDFAQSNIREELMTQLISSISWSNTRIHLEN